MSSGKTQKLGMHKWVPNDYVQMSEFNENFQKIDDNAAEVNEQLATNDEQITSIKDYTIKLWSPAFLFDGSDESSKLQAILDRYVSWEERVTLEFPSGLNINLENLQFNGRLNVKGNGISIYGTGGYVFKNKDGGGAILHIDDANLFYCGLANFEMLAGVSSSLRVKCNKINAYGGTEDSPQCTFYRGASNDFLDFQNVTLYWYENTFVTDFTAGVHRMNTQLSFSQIDIHFCKKGFYLKGVDKVTFRNIDMARVGIGFHFGQYVKRVHGVACHIEGYGNYADMSGYGYIFDNVNQVREVTFEDGSIKNPHERVTSAISTPAITSTSITTDNIIQTEWNQMEVDKVADGKNTVVLNGFFKWRGDIKDDYIFNLYNSRIISGIVEPIQSYYVYHKNLLAINEIQELTDFEGGTVGLTISEEGFLKKITNGSASVVSPYLGFVVKETGWYTLIFNGDTTNIETIVKIQQDGSPYNVFKSVRCYNANNQKTNVVYFKVDSIARNCRVVFDIYPMTNLYINSISVYRGFKTQF